MAKYKRQRPVIAGMSKSQYYKRQKEMREAGTLPEDMTLETYLSQNPNPNPDPASESTISNSEPAEQNQDNNIPVEVEVQASKGSTFGDLLKRATDGLKESFTGDEPAPRRGRPSKTNRDDFSVLVVSLVALLVSFAKVPEEVKPVKSEIDMFSSNASDILLRHLPINGKLSADALNLIGMFTAIATWRVRVGPVLESMKANQLPAGGPRTQQSQQITQAKNNGRVPTPIEEASPADADFLNGAARRMAGAE